MTSNPDVDNLLALVRANLVQQFEGRYVSARARHRRNQVFSWSANLVGVIAIIINALIMSPVWAIPACAMVAAGVGVNTWVTRRATAAMREYRQWLDSLHSSGHTCESRPKL